MDEVGWGRPERFGLLSIVALLFFSPPIQIVLREAILKCTASISWPLGIWGEPEPILREALFG